MTNDELLSRYILSRQLWWQYTLEQLDAQAVADIIKTLEAVQRDLRKRLADDADGLAQVTDWTRERMQQVEAWTDEVLASARGTLLTTISEATITAATVSLAAHNAILSLDGAATGVHTVGLTREQIVSWFDDTTLGAGGLQKWVDTALDNGVKSSILQALRQAGVEGEGTAEAVRRVMSAALDTGFNITQREAITVTRTFIQTANVRAQEATYKANEKLLRGYKRVETLDNRTCIQCFTGGTEVSPLGKILGVSKREYVGDVVIITTATGKKLEGTPNHPILTPDGWLPLDKVKPNQKVINAEFLKAGSFAGANDVCVPTSFSELYDSFSSLTTCKVSVVRASPEDFHGDGMGSNEDVNVHCSTLLLRDDVIDSSVDELSVDDKLTTIKMPAPFLAKCELLKLLFASFESLGLTSKLPPKVFQDGVNPALRTLESFADFLGANSAVEHCKRPLCGNLAGTSTLIPFDILHDFEVNKEFGNSGSSNAIFDSKFASGDSASVFVDNVVSVKRETRTCHVYNLQSCLGVYIAGGIIVKNCALADGAEYAVGEERPRLPSHARCRGMYTPLVKSWKDLGITGPALEEAARPWVMREPGPIGTGGRKILYAGTTKASFEGWWKSLSAEEKAMTPIGPVRTKLLESGAVKWDDLWDKRTGLPLTLEQVGYNRSKQIDILYPGRKTKSTQSLKDVSFNKDTSIDDIVKYGKSIFDELPSPRKDVNAFHSALLERMKKDVGIGVPCKTISSGAGADIVGEASRLFPARWNSVSDSYGGLKAKATKNRAFYRHYKGEIPSEIVVNNFLTVAVHEYAHRLQHTMRDIDAKFQEIHRKRTKGEELEKMRKLFPKYGYKDNEVTRKDGYFHPYMGKEYKNEGALELMSMSFQAVLGHNKKDIERGYPSFLEQIIEKDEEMVHFVIGLIFGWKG